MMCDECGVRPANIHLTTFVDGEKRERNLCATCMTKYRKQLPNIDFSNLAGLLGGFLEKALSGGKEDKNDEATGAICPVCHTTYAEFKKTGMLGCAECYKAFREPLEELLKRMHGNTQHNGRVPGGVDSKVSMRLTLDKLKQQLVKAIAAEEYESAANLRDQIRALNAQLEKHETDHADAKEDAKK